MAVTYVKDFLIEAESSADDAEEYESPPKKRREPKRIYA